MTTKKYLKVKLARQKTNNLRIVPNPMEDVLTEKIRKDVLKRRKQEKAG